MQVVAGVPMSESELDPWIFTDRGLDSQWVRRDEQQQPEEPGHKRRRTRFAPLRTLRTSGEDGILSRRRGR